MLEATTLTSLVEQAATAEAAGIALGWLPSHDHAALLAAAAVGARTSSLRLAACVRVGTHPLEIAEGAAVADNVTNGRLILVLEAVEDDPALLRETAAAVLTALAPRPFRHAGARWTIPANLPGNDLPEERIVVRPPVVQTQLPVWLMGPGASGLGLPFVGGAGGSADAARPAVLDVDGAFDADALVERLLAARREWGLDTAVIRLPAALGDAARREAIRTLARHVAPRVVMHELPAGVEAHWRATL